MMYLAVFGLGLIVGAAATAIWGTKAIASVKGDISAINQKLQSLKL